MKSRQFLIPFLISVVVTPFLLLLALISTGAGHGDYFWARVLFPFTMNSLWIVHYISYPFVALAVIQFPLYGFLLGQANIRGRFRRCLTLLLLIHSLAAIVLFVV